jgi:hypothetical protein
MKMQSPGIAILWEMWRVTRVEAAWKLTVGLVGGFAVLALSAALALAVSDNAARSRDIKDMGAAAAMILLVLPHLVGWLTPGRLNGGRAGFPLYLHFTRPVRTAVITGLPMAYLTAMSMSTYLVSSLLLRAASGHAFPLLPVAAWIAALTLIGVAAGWSTRHRVIGVVVMVYAIAKIWGTAMGRLTAVEIPETFDWPPRLWPTLFDFPLTDYLLIGAIGLVSFGVAVAGVARQRHGGPAAAPSAQREGLRDRLVSLFRVPCPSSSAMRAQAWLELRYSGLPLLTIGVVLATVLLLLSAVGGPIDAAFAAEIRAHLSCTNPDCFYARPMPALLAPLSLLILLALGANAFGIRRRQGRTYLNAFETTQAHGTAQLTSLKLLVKAACLLVALLTLVASMWTSVLLLGDAVFIQMWNLPLGDQLRATRGAIAAMTAYEQVSMVVVATVGLVVWVAALAVVGALRARYPRRVNIAACSLLLAGLALALLALAQATGAVSSVLVHATFVAVRWSLLAGAVATTAYVFWRGFAERILTARYALGAAVISAAFAAASLTLAGATGLQLSVVPQANLALILLVSLLLPLSASVLAPWSYSRIRHI